MRQFKWQTETTCPKDVTFAWFEHRGSFRRLMPPWEVAEEIKADNTLEVGSQRVFRFPMGPIKMTWVAEHTSYDPPHHFTDKMVKGPFRYWCHNHTLTEANGVTTVTDEVTYQVPFRSLGHLIAGRSIRKRLARMFHARELRLRRDLKRHMEFSDFSRKRILIAGSSGLIGTQLSAFLDTGGHDVWKLVRRDPLFENKEIFWNPNQGEINSSDIEGFDVIIHLGGEGIGDKRWSQKRKQAILDSRVNSTILLAKTMSRIDKKPDLFIIANAIGWYGDRKDEILDESSENGEGFLPEICKKWEESSKHVEGTGIRKIHLRTGIVLDATGGALAKMLLPAKLGIGGPIGRGKQWMSWISMDDQIYAINHLLMMSNTEGVYNLVSPNPIQQKFFARTLGNVLRRPAFIPTPPLAIRVLYGQMGVSLTTESQRVLPKRLIESGYNFEHDDLKIALQDSLGKWKL
ncbi:MAG: TIGR01777 family oxidoreductase [Candidatus Thalassarchaeaceae archaeon]|jgi:hypothetical protein|nr:TIGR01777 family oxidoreductase [Candidatus Thalassarchaeaceae archaeon]